MKHSQVNGPQVDGPQVNGDAENAHNAHNAYNAHNRAESLRPLARCAMFARDNVMLCAAAAAALITCLFVPFDTAYLGYVDVKTIACLFSILAVVGAMRNLGMFQYAARKVILRFGSCRAAVSALVGVTLVVSMVATNDMALIMMLPLSAATLLAAGWGRALPFTFVMQNLAANLGGMILPFGNPQNLYLFEYFHIDLFAFLQTMSLPFAVSVALIVLCCAFGARAAIASGDVVTKSKEANYRIRSKREATPYHFFETAAQRLKEGKLPVPHVDERTRRWLFAYVYLFLMLLTILSVFRIVPYAFSTMIVVLTLAFMDRRAIQTLDYGLLLTFVFFFVFAGNMARIPAVDQVLSGVMAQWPLAVSVGLSQVISNVPAAVLLSHFTEGWQALLVGVNIGGAGTIVGSLATLITLQHYRAVRRDASTEMQRADGECRASGARHANEAQHADEARRADGARHANEARHADEAQHADEPEYAPVELPSSARFAGFMTVYNMAFLLVLFIAVAL